MDKPFSQACENNKGPILDVLREAFAGCTRVLEVGSGTAQHALHFSAQMPWLSWQPSERAEHLAGIRAWMAEGAPGNLLLPLELDVEQAEWPAGPFDAVFSANTSHIMGWPQVQRAFARIGALLPSGGVFCLYGPFNYGGAFTSESNARFDALLRQRDAASGLRDFEAIDALARASGLQLQADHPMPANNRLLEWRKG